MEVDDNNIGSLISAEAALKTKNSLYTSNKKIKKNRCDRSLAKLRFSVDYPSVPKASKKENEENGFSWKKNGKELEL